MLLKGATLASLDPPAVQRADLRVRDGRIEARGDLVPAAGEEVADLSGRVVLPGLVNAHTHLYSALARGMPAPAERPRNFREILERVWWRLDRALDLEMVELSALAGGVEAALSGTTVLVDHHSSPHAITGSLDRIRRALEQVGLRSVLCYEVTDRNGVGGRDLGLAENLSFARSPRGGLSRGMVGAHASFTLSDESLDRLREAVAATGTSLHLHVAEDRFDVEDSRARHGLSLPARLRAHGLVTACTICAHCVHLDPAEMAEVAAQGGWIVHNPRSNMNNAVGTADAAAMQRAALGTDGMDQDLWAETRTAFLKLREADRGDAYGGALGLLAGGHRLASALFGVPLGKLDQGGVADLVVLDYDPPTPLHAGNLAGHLLFGIDRSHVQSVMVDGRWVVGERRLLTVDAAAVRARARAAAAVLWERMQKLP